MSELQDISDRIAKVGRKIRKLNREMNTLMDRRRLIADKHVIEIWKEKDGNGKPIYSNQRVRSAELNVRLHGDREWLEVSQECNRLGDELQEAIAEANGLQSRREILMLELGAHSLKERSEGRIDD